MWHDAANMSPVGHCESHCARTLRPLGGGGAAPWDPGEVAESGSLGVEKVLKPRTLQWASLPAARKTSTAMQNQVSQTGLGNRKNHTPLDHTVPPLSHIVIKDPTHFRFEAYSQNIFL